MLYDDAWAMVMQHSAVMESDFSAWLSEWKTAGFLQITNQQPSQRLARKGQNQFLEWRTGGR
jgi:hypothetical protein